MAAELDPATSVEVTVKITTNDQASTSSKFIGYRVQLISEWLACNGATPLFGKDTLPWEQPDETTPDGDVPQEPSDDGNEDPSAAEVPLMIEKSATFSKCFPLPTLCSEEDEAERKSQLSIFNTSPGMYAVLCGIAKIETSTTNDAGEMVTTKAKKIVPVAFSYVDCSSLLLKAGAKVTRNVEINGHHMEVRVQVQSPLVAYDHILEYEPLTIEIKR